MPLTYWSRSCLPIDKGLIDVFKRSDNGSRILRVVCCHTTILERNHHLDQRQQRLTSRSLESSSATVIAMPRSQTSSRPISSGCLATYGSIIDVYTLASRS